MKLSEKNSDSTMGLFVPRRFRIVLLMVMVYCCWVATAVSGPFPAAGDDSFPSKGLFKVTLSPALGGTTMVIGIEGPTCVARSGPHMQGADPSGPLGDGSSCTGSASAATSDAETGFFPSGYNSGGGVDEVHTEILDMTLTNAAG